MSASKLLKSFHRNPFFVQETLIFGEEENKSFEPAEWRDYMNERLSSTSEGTVTPLSCSAPDLTSLSSGSLSAASSLAASVDGCGSGTGTPPITAVSPCPPPAVSASPLISPDSLLEGQTLEESYIPSTPQPPTSCPECDRNSMELANLRLQDNSQVKT